MIPTRPAAGSLSADSTPASITPGLLYLVSENAPSRVILAAGAGGFAQAVIHETDGIYLPEAERTPETIAARFGEIGDLKGMRDLKGAFEQTDKFVAKAAAARGIALPKRD